MTSMNWPIVSIRISLFSQDNTYCAIVTRMMYHGNDRIQWVTMVHDGSVLWSKKCLKEHEEVWRSVGSQSGTRCRPGDRLGDLSSRIRRYKRCLSVLVRGLLHSTACSSAVSGGRRVVLFSAYERREIYFTMISSSSGMTRMVSSMIFIVRVILRPRRGIMRGE